MARPHPTVHYPEVQVDLIPADGNALAIVAAVCLALRRMGIDDEDIAIFRKDAMAADYTHLLSTVRAWVTVRPNRLPPGWGT